LTEVPFFFEHGGLVPPSDHPEDEETHTSTGPADPGPPSGVPHPCLVVLGGPVVARTFELGRTATVIGRSSKATVHLDDQGISRLHARVRISGDGFVVEDLKSANGTFVNGHRVTAHRLQEGDKIQIGKTALRFTYLDAVDKEYTSRLYDAALYDQLTRTFNRRYLVDRMEIELAYARRHGSPVSLLMIDVDHFKQVNDSYGHIAGDEVLSTLATIVRGALRAEDTLARYGGEEFAVLLRGLDLGSAQHLGERLRALVEGSPFERNGARLAITVSVGVAAYPAGEFATPDELLSAADQALYQAKRAGRNRVAVQSVRK
jgi:diguanylate cyclase (GGDEF)-like protein